MTARPLNDGLPRDLTENHQTSDLGAWTSQIDRFWRDSVSMLVGLFDLDGNLLEANVGMREFLDVGSGCSAPSDALVNPSFEKIRELAPVEGPVFEGQLTVGNRYDVSRTARARIYRGRDRVLIIGEIDVGDLMQRTADLSALNQEANNLRRKVLKEKRLLEIALAERIRTEERLHQAQKIESLGNLAAGIAHNINNLLVPVMMLSEILATDPSIDRGARGKLKLIYSSSEKAAAIVRQMMIFSEVDSPHFAEVDLSAAISDALELVLASAPDNVKCERAIDPQTGTLSADPSQLKMVVFNIFSNAMDALEGNAGTISVELGPYGIGAGEVQGLPPGRYARFAITDTGCGMDTNTKERLFDPFFTTKEVGKGTGLGLSVVHGIVCQHKGAVRVESAPNKGTTVEIFLPLAVTLSR